MRLQALAALLGAEEYGFASSALGEGFSVSDVELKRSLNVRSWRRLIGRRWFFRLGHRGNGRQEQRERAREDPRQRVILLLWDRIKLVIVAAGTTD